MWNPQPHFWLLSLTALQGIAMQGKVLAGSEKLATPAKALILLARMLGRQTAQEYLKQSTPLDERVDQRPKPHLRNPDAFGGEANGEN